MNRSFQDVKLTMPSMRRRASRGSCSRMLFPRSLQIVKPGWARWWMKNCISNRLPSGAWCGAQWLSQWRLSSATSYPTDHTVGLPSN